MNPRDIAIGKIYTNQTDLEQRKVLEIGSHIRPQAVEMLQVPPGDPGLRYQQVGGHYAGLIDETYLTAFALWADAEVKPGEPIAPQATWMGPRR